MSSVASCAADFQGATGDVVATMLHAGSHDFSQEDPFGDLRLFRDVERDLTRLAHLGVKFSKAAFSGPVQHAPSAWLGDEWSEYSTHTHHLSRNLWYSIDVTSRCDDQEWQLVVESTRSMFHGTTWGAAYKIIGMGEGFIPGEGTHKKNSRSCSGAWVVPTCGEAVERAEPVRWARQSARGQPLFSRLCTPVVLEVRCAHLTQMPGQSRKHCCEGPMGVAHTGIVVTKIHLNLQFMESYMRLECPDIRQDLELNYYSRICGCRRLCGRYIPGQDMWKWPKSGRGIRYHPSCFDRVRGDQITAVI